MTTSTGRAAVLLLGAQLIQLLTQVASLVVLSHLLAPATFGSFAAVSAVAGLASVLAGFGLSLSAISGPQPSAAERTGLFWLNTFGGLLAAALVIAVSPLVAWFYDRAALGWLTASLSLQFVFAAIAVQFRVELNLRRAWRDLAIVQALPGLIILPLVAGLAAVFDSYWVLTVQAVGTSVLALIFALRLCPWRPSRPRRLSGMTDHLSFGRDTSGVVILNYVASNADSVLIGKRLGDVALGEYNRAYNLSTLAASQIAAPLEQLVVPRLAHAAASGTLKPAVERCQKVMVYIQLLPLSVLFGDAHPAVEVLFGSHWARVPSLIWIQVLGCAMAAIGYIFWWTMLVVRRTRLMLFTEGLLNIALVVAMIVTVRSGSSAVAWSVDIAQALIAVSAALLCRSAAAINLGAICRASLVAIVLSVAAGGVARLVTDVHLGSAALSLVLASAAWLGVLTVAWAVSRSVRSDLGLLYGFLRDAARG